MIAVLIDFPVESNNFAALFLNSLSQGYPKQPFSRLFIAAFVKATHVGLAVFSRPLKNILL